jgi:hypothetical protein
MVNLYALLVLANKAKKDKSVPKFLVSNHNENARIFKFLFYSSLPAGMFSHFHIFSFSHLHICTLFTSQTVHGISYRRFDRLNADCY